jgi:hypothetical protein
VNSAAIRLDMQSDHAELETLREYHQGRLDEAEASRLRDHLVSCQECARQLLSLAAFDDVEPAPVDLATVREATLMSRAIVAQERARRWRTITSVAAGLLLVSGGILLFRELAMRGRMPTLARLEPSQDNPNLPIASLSPLDDARTRGTVVPLRIPAGAPFAGILLAVREPARDPAYRVEIHDREGKIVLTRTGLVPTEVGNLRFWAPAQALEEGDFQILLYGRTPAGERLVETYALTVARGSE